MTDPAAPVPVERLLEHRAWVLALARALVSDRHQAEDVAQDAWLAALAHPPRHDASLRAWFARIVRRRAADVRRGDDRRATRDRAIDGAGPTSNPAEAVGRIEEHRRVVDAVLALDEPYRTTVVLRFYEGLTGPEIAERMSVPVETVRTRIKRAFAQLRGRLDAEHGGDGASWRAALVPLAWQTGGVVMKTSTKAGVAAAIVLFGATAVWTWPRPVAASAAPEGVVVAAAPASPEPATAAPSTKADDAKSAAVFGEVWRRGPEAPAAGVAVRMTSDGSPDRTAVADAHGHFRFESLPPGARGTVRVAVDDKVAEPVAVAPLLVGESRFVGVLWLAPSESADVVVASIDGTPLPGARVAAYQKPVLTLHRSVLGSAWYDDDTASATWRDARDPAAAATTDAAGHATLAGLVAGNWHFTAEADGYGSASRVEVVASRRATTVRFSLVPGLGLAGRVEDRAGKPFAGLVVCAYAGERLDPNVAETVPRATTDVDGRFALRGLDAGRTILWVARPGRSPMPALDVRLPASGPVRVVLGGAGMQGTVRDAATGVVVAAARVRALVSGAGRSAWLDAVTDDRGAYDMEFFAGRAFVNAVRVESFSVVEDPLADRGKLLGSAFDIRDDKVIRLDLKVRGGAGIRGRVTHAGQPVRGADVRAFALSAPGDSLVAVASTDGDGRYEIHGMAGTLAVVRVTAAPYAQPGFPHADLITYLRAGRLPPRWGVRVPPDGGATLDVELVDGADVAGRVVDPADQPIDGAELVLGDTVTTSAADGSFVFRGVDRDASNGVTASRDGFTDCAVGLGPSPLTIRMTPCRIVRGTVRATDGVLESAWVQYAPKYGVDERRGTAPPVDWEKARRASVAADGSFRFGPGLAFSRIAVRAASRGHGPSAPIDVVLDGAQPPPELQIDLAPSAVLKGQVLAEDGSPVAGASIELDRAKIDRWDDDGRAVALHVDAATDEVGRFEIASVSPQSHRLLAVADGFFGAIVDADPSVGDVVVRLARALEIRGFVLRSDGVPLAGTAVTLFPRGATEPGAWSGPNWHASVRPDGSFRAFVPPGVYWARVSPSSRRVSFEPARFDDVAAGTTDAKFVVDTTRGISGRVVGGDGAPIANAEIWFRQASDPPNRMSATARSGDDGRFEVLGLLGDRYSADARPPAASNAGVFVLNKRYLRARVEGIAAGTSGLELRLPLGAEIAGTLVDEKGAPAAGRSVVVHPLAKLAPEAVIDNEKPGAVTAADGRFVVTGVAPGRYRLDEIASATMTATPLVGGEDVEAGATGLRLSLPHTTSISGRVVDEAGVAFAGVGVVARRADGSSFASATLADGTFAIPGVPDAGTFNVEAKVNKRAPMRAVDVAPGATDVQIRLVRGARAGGRLLDAAGKPVTPATLVFRTEHGDIEASAYVDADGRFSVENLLPGAYRVEQMTSKGGEFVYVLCGAIRAGDERVELRRTE